MHKIILLGLSISILISCGNNSGSESISAGSTTSDQSNAATTSTTTSGTTADNSFQGATNKMMQQMHTMKMTEDPDHDFAMMMKAHHQGAIDMSNIELSQGKNEELKQVAQKVITDSQKDISQLDNFLSSYQPDTKSNYAKRIMDKMMSNASNMNMNHGGDIDQQFAMMMAMHHQEGIDMAKDYLKSAKEEQTKKVANSTIKANSEDLKTLKKHQGSHSSGMAGHDMR
ncbi:Uncharacterized conserved protein, DUF305 family [Cnuella takakiae]|uniref:Uncharacterized conserved protein, DUF305 family n=1 Tax=Cnuella takakiae TaxID=1302690 RepID=A0A1M4SPT4_9BACT|nr:DUF305 domain-containing protein [Cnuella takakiae]OLY94558.1 hypothetical protein BUE76_23820 [Cnuella takakiae]SHE33957.1 Uncharacterized conserved protein, DUF305 family [Cnuella takakiae]